MSTGLDGVVVARGVRIGPESVDWITRRVTFCRFDTTFYRDPKRRDIYRNRTHLLGFDATMASWIEIKEDSDFSLRNLPYGVFSTDGPKPPRIGIAIGDHVLDMSVLAADGVFDDIGFDVKTITGETTLNSYAAQGKDVHSKVRKRLQDLLEKETKLGSLLRDNQGRRARALVPMNSVKMHLPMAIGDYTDFFIGLHHAVIVSFSPLLLSSSSYKSYVGG